MNTPAFPRPRFSLRRLRASAMLAPLLLLAPPLAHAALNLETATIAELEAAMDKGALTSEKLTELYLARIAAYDKQGPTINSVIVITHCTRVMIDYLNVTVIKFRMFDKGNL